MSTGSSSVPVGANEPAQLAPRASDDDDLVQLTMRDIGDDVIRLPDRRAGVVVFAVVRGCTACIAAVRAADVAVRDGGAAADLTVVIVDAAITRNDADALTRAVGPSRARYVVDDRDSRLATVLGAKGLADIVVYDARGRLLEHPEPTTPRIAAALRRAG